MFEFLKKKKPFKCGGEQRILFEGGGRSASIWFRQPTGDEQLNYAHAALSEEKSELKQLSSENVSAETLHRMTREKKFLPFAKSIITRWAGYQDENGKEVKDIDYLEKYFPHHLEVVAIEGYKVDDKYKKKD